MIMGEGVKIKIAFLCNAQAPTQCTPTFPMPLTKRIPTIHLGLDMLSVCGYA